MPSQKNINQLKQIKDKLDQTSSLIFVNHTGISVADQQALRQNLNEKQGSFNVTKNTLIRLALKDRSETLVEELEEVLHGPTAIVYGQDPVEVSKTLAEFQKDHEDFTIKAGISLKKGQDRVLSAADIKALSKLPGKQELYAKLLAQLNAPIQGLTRIINAPIQNLVYVLQNHAERG